MPQTVVQNKTRLSPAFRRDLREFLADFDIEILSCVHWRNAPPWHLPTRQCPDSFFLFPLRGTIRLTIHGYHTTIAPGGYLALPDALHHSLTLLPGHPRLEQIALHAHIRDRWGRPFLHRFTQHHSTLLEPARWYRQLADLASLTLVDPDLARHTGKILLRQLLIDRLQDEQLLRRVLPPKADPRIAAIVDRMKTDCFLPGLTIENLARDVQLTGSQMRKLFRRELHLGPKQYLQRLRLDRAVRLLRHTSHPVKQIAYDCGFMSDNYFVLVFEKAFNISPYNYRLHQHL